MQEQSLEYCILEVIFKPLKKAHSPFMTITLMMKSVLNALRITGNNISDVDVIMCVLASVGSEYNLIVTNITSMQETLSLLEVYSMLLSQEKYD